MLAIAALVGGWLLGWSWLDPLMGVVGAVTPITNPIVTPMCNGMFALKTGNAVIFAPHPKAQKCAEHLTEEFRRIAKEHGAPEDLIQVVKEGSITKTQQLMQSVDVVVATGEQVTIGLLALALQQEGVKSRSWVSWQIPIKTDDAFAKARILEIDTTAMGKTMEQGEVPIVPGFQGVAPDGRITTLGRGGSDTSAVALAAALKADRCDIYTDVDGVYTTDPRIVPKARKLDRISYEEMLELASVGAKVLQTRSVELAMNERVRVQVLSSFQDLPGTLMVDEDEIVEKQNVSGIAYSRDEAKITVRQIKDRPGIAAALFGVLTARDRGGPLVAGLGAMLAWAALLGYDATQGPVGTVAATLGGVLQVKAIGVCPPMVDVIAGPPPLTRCASEASISWSRSPSRSTVQEGFCGLFTMMSRVRSLIDARTRSQSYRKSGGVIGRCTQRAPARRTAGS